MLIVRLYVSLICEIRSFKKWGDFLVLAGHDVEDHLVGGAHGVGADDGEVADAAVDVVVDDALGAGDVAAFHGEHGAEQGGGDA